MGHKNAPPLSQFGGPSNLDDPMEFASGVQNVVNVIRATPVADVHRGQVWYPKVHEAADKARRGTSMSLRQNAGVIAATSPNMDFEAVNIHALREVHKIKRAGWETIIQSSMQGGKRSPAAQDVLKGLSIASNTDENLVKAHRIMQGEDLDDVLHPVNAPKTNSFANNIEDPVGERFTGLTIDGRAHDIVRNQMLPWGTTRSIGGSAPARRRYSQFEEVHHAAREVVQDALHIPAPGPAIQAIAWVGGKHLERMMTPKGPLAKQGPPRRGQRYV